MTLDVFVLLSTLYTAAVAVYALVLILPRRMREADMVLHIFAFALSWLCGCVLIVWGALGDRGADPVGKGFLALFFNMWAALGAHVLVWREHRRCK